jgi:hypothetical protein
MQINQISGAATCLYIHDIIQFKLINCIINYTLMILRTVLLFCVLSLAQVHGISITTITGSTLSAGGGKLFFQGTGFTLVGPMICAIIPYHNHVMSIINDNLMTCVIQDEGALGSTYPLYIANPTVILFTFTNQIYVSSTYPQITELGTGNFVDPLITWLPNCAMTAGLFTVYRGNYIPNDPSLYRYMELKSSGGYSYAVVYPSSTAFWSPWPFNPTPDPALTILYNANTVVITGAWADMYLAWGTGGSYTKVTSALELCDDGISCVRRGTNECFYKFKGTNATRVISSTTYYDPTPSMRNDTLLKLKPWDTLTLNLLDVFAKHTVKSFSSVQAFYDQTYTNTSILCHNVACI